MARGQGTKEKRKPLKYFYLNGNLHKKLSINRGADEIVAWCYPLHKRVVYTYSQVLKHKRPAFTTPEVCKMLNRSRYRLIVAMREGFVSRPQYTYGLTDKGERYANMWSEDDVMSLHSYFKTVHRGRPRKDGLVVPQQMPSASELRAMMRNDTVKYVKVGDEFRPIWEAEDFS